MLKEILSNNELRPIIIGLIVGGIGYFVVAFSKKKQNGDRSQQPHTAGKKYPMAVQVAYGLGIAGFLTSFVSYAAGIFPQNDWRGLGLGVALMMYLPTLWVLAYWQVTKIKLRPLLDEINGESSFTMFVIMYSFLNIIGLCAVVHLLVDWPK